MKEEYPFNELIKGLREIAELNEQEFTRSRTAKQNSFFNALKDSTVVYAHVSHKLKGHNFIKILEENYKDNILITYAPETSGQSFYDDSRDKAAEIEKRKQVREPLEKFSAKKSIDTVIYLCNYLCDGYQSPIFPEDVITNWHIWHAIKTAENFQKQLIVGYQERFCFGVECYEREYITSPEKIKFPIKIMEI